MGASCTFAYFARSYALTAKLFTRLDFFFIKLVFSIILFNSFFKYWRRKFVIIKTWIKTTVFCLTRCEKKLGSMQQRISQTCEWKEQAGIYLQTCKVYFPLFSLYSSERNSISNQGSKGIRQLPINLCTSMIHNYPLCYPLS